MEQKPKPISPADLRIDHKNPRIPNEATSQREALHALAEHQKDRLVVLAEHIVTFKRLNPADLPIVMPSEEEAKRYTVLEGNRRLTALRALESPDLFSEVLEPRLLKKIRTLSAEYASIPIAEVYCIVMEDRAEAQPWIDLRHNGVSGGAGIWDWGHQEKARNRARLGGPIGVHTYVLNFLQDSGHLSPSDRQKVKATTLQRMLENPDIRAAVGIEVKKGNVRFIRAENEVVSALMYMIGQLLSGEKDVQDVYTEKQRKQYAADFPKTLKPRPKPAGAPIPQQGQLPLASTADSPQTGTARKPKIRDKLMPPDCFLKVKDARVRSIEIELRGLLLEDYPNAITVLFRVFLELSVDYYRSMILKRAPEAVRDRLKDKLLDVMGDLETKGALTRQEANPVRIACQKASFLLPSVVTMHEYIHNRQLHPSPTDLRAEWDSLQPFIVAIWPR